MNSDIRAISFRGHRKRKRLRLSLGANATDYLLDLWIGAALNHPRGILQGMDETDIALEAGWEEESQKFVAALIECGFLEKNEHGAYVLHDWEDHQGYAVHAETRKAKAKKAAAKRWQQRNATSIPQACIEQCNEDARGNAPSPNPEPNPVPSPNPIPNLSLVPALAQSSKGQKKSSAEISENT